jgi:hypothetical protein
VRVVTAFGFSRAGRSRDSFEICSLTPVVTGTTDEEFDASRADARTRIAFYGSTPAYRSVLELHGWDALHDDLNRLSMLGRWLEMPGSDAPTWSQVMSELRAL